MNNSCPIIQFKLSLLKIICFSMLLLSQTIINGQTISGKVLSRSGEFINNANIIAKDSANSKSVVTFTLARNGQYIIELPKNTTSITIEVKAISYITSSHRFNKIDTTTSIMFDFILLKDTVKYLETVTITAKANPYKVRGDTAIFKVSGYTDGTERKIQDIIKKLPGIELNEKTGEIKYKGKLIETVKLDGDDLFGENYTIGTKNINVDAVEAVQAIENYSANPLLKGIETGGKVALNLTLKKNDLDISGDFSLGIGSFSNRLTHNSSFTLLGVSKKYKSFATSSFNNIGENNTPFDYYANNKSVEQILNELSIASKYLEEPIFNTTIERNRQNINSNLWCSYNVLQKLGSKASLKANMYYLTDKIASEQFYENINNIDGQIFNTSDEYFLTKKPVQYRADLELKFNNTKSSLIEYQIKYKKEKVQSFNQVLQNKASRFNSDLETNDDFFDQKFIYTNRLSDKNAVILVARYSNSKVPQSSFYNPAIIDSMFFRENTQFSSFEKNKLNLQTILLGSNLKKSKYRSSLSGDFQSLNFNSLLTGSQDNGTQNISGFENNIHYKTNNIGLNNQYSFLSKRFQFQIALNSSFMSQALTNNSNATSLRKENFLIQPFLNISLKTSTFSKLIFSTGYNQRAFNETNFVPNKVLISTREIKQNLVSLDLQKTKSISISYMSLNLSKNFETSTNLLFVNSRGNYFTTLDIMQNRTTIINLFLPESNNSFSSSLMCSKYISSLRGTLKLRGNLAVNWYKNIINSSNLRNNQTSLLTTELFYKTKIKKQVTIDNTITNFIMQTKSSSNFKVSNIAISNCFQFVYNISDKGYFAIVNDFFIPNLRQSQSYYSFLDISANIRTKNQHYDFTLKLKNVSNTRYLRQIQTLDYATSISQSNLLTRHFIFSISRNF